MNLDKRIRNITDIQSVINSNKEVIGKKGYFADNIGKFKDLSKCRHGTVNSYREDDKCFCHTMCFTNRENDITWFSYFIPEDSLIPIEKNYRPFSLDEFVNQYSLGDEIIVRRKSDKDKIRHRLFIEYTENEEQEEVRLGSFFFNFKELLDKYEVYTGEGWKPFGLLEE